VTAHPITPIHEIAIRRVSCAAGGLTSEAKRSDRSRRPGNRGCQLRGSP